MGRTAMWERRVTRRAQLAGMIGTGLACLAATGAGAGADPVLPHARGTLSLARVPRTVLVYDLAALDILDALGVAVAGVPDDVKPGYLTRYDAPSYRKIGTLFEPDFEVVNAMAPDLVIVGARTAARYDALSAMAPTADLTVPSGDLLGGCLRNARTLGAVFDREAEAERRTAALLAAIATVKGKAATAGTALVVLTSAGKVSTYGPGSRFGMMHDTLGLRAAVPDLKPSVHGQPISFEFIAKADPDWLFVVDRDAAVGRQGQPAARLLDNELVRPTKAWTAGRLVYLDPGALYLVGPGLTALQRTADQVGAALDRAT